MKNFKRIQALTFAIGIILSSSVLKVSAQQTKSSAVSTTKTSLKQDLPPSVKKFLTQYYPNITVAKYEFKKNQYGNEYEVRLNNGVEVEFDSAGKWKEVKDYQGVPVNLVPEKVTTYVTQNYPKIKIKSIEKNTSKNKIEIELLNDVELDFDMDGNFLKIDR